MFTSVHYSNDDKTHLTIVFKSDNTEGTYEIHADNNGQRYIGNTEKYHVIEDQSQIDARIASGDFKRCIFMCPADFSNATFNQNANFLRAIFSQNAKFFYATFSKNANFCNATFSQDVDFFMATFSQNATFSRARFSQNADFYDATFSHNATFSDARFSQNAKFFYATFSHNAYFSNATFSHNADFMVATFSQNAKFLGATFSHNANFSRATFSQDADFSNSTCEGVFDFYLMVCKDLLNMSETEIRTLNLKSTVLNTVEYTDMDIEDAKNRETFQVLKNMAVKQNDTIAALDFHTREMRTHMRDTDKVGNCFILVLEDYTSTFGTNPYKAICWLVGVHAIFGICSTELSYYFSDIWYTTIPELLNIVCEVINATIINSIYETMTIWKDTHDNSGWRLLKFILSSFLLYEIIKSFRKYSRKI